MIYGQKYLATLLEINSCLVEAENCFTKLTEAVIDSINSDKTEEAEQAKFDKIEKDYKKKILFMQSEL